MLTANEPITGVYTEADNLRQQLNDITMSTARVQNPSRRHDIFLLVSGEHAKRKAKEKSPTAAAERIF